MLLRTFLIIVRSSERSAALWVRRVSDCRARFFAEAILAIRFPYPLYGTVKKGRYGTVPEGISQVVPYVLAGYHGCRDHEVLS
jgi:hypothetical protein